MRFVDCLQPFQLDVYKNRTQVGQKLYLKKNFPLGKYNRDLNLNCYVHFHFMNKMFLLNHLYTNFILKHVCNLYINPILTNESISGYSTLKKVTGKNGRSGDHRFIVILINDCVKSIPSAERTFHGKLNQSNRIQNLPTCKTLSTQPVSKSFNPLQKDKF